MTTINNNLTIGSIIVGTCDNLSHEGVGICHISSENQLFTIFVENLLPNEKAQIKITKLTKNYGYGEIVSIYSDTRSPLRNNPPCPSYAICGGCNIMHLNYQGSLNFKKSMLTETLRKIGKLDNPNVQPVIGMDNPSYYRNKVQVPFQNESNKTICGFFARNTHQVIPLKECLIQPPISTEIVNFIKNLCNEFKIAGYNEQNQTGLIRHVLVRTNNDLSAIMIVLVLTQNNLPSKSQIISKIIKRYPNVSSIIINVNDQKTNTILGKNCYPIYGNDYIEDTLLGLKFRIGAKSFYQVNHEQTEKLYATALKLANLQKTDVLIDAYCGIGTIGLIASKMVKQVYAVEIVQEAIENAMINAKINKINNISFECQKAEEQIIKWQKQNIKADAIVVDPPRKGCDEKLLATIIQMEIKKIIYISCDPATLARDLKYLTSKGYEIKIIQPVDMFPYTSNLETIVQLYRK